MTGALPVPSLMGSTHSRGRSIWVLPSRGTPGRCGGQPPAALGKHRLGMFQQLVPRGDRADGAVQTHRVVVALIHRHQPPHVGQGDRALGADALTFEGLVQTLKLPVAFEMEGRGAHRPRAPRRDATESSPSRACSLWPRSPCSAALKGHRVDDPHERTFNRPRGVDLPIDRGKLGVTRVVPDRTS